MMIFMKEDNFKIFISILREDSAKLELRYRGQIMSMMIWLDLGGRQIYIRSLILSKSMIRQGRRR